MILGLDQSLTCSGYVIFDNQKIVETGTIKPKANLPIEQRLSYIWKELTNLYNQYNFDLVIFEDIQQQNNVGTYKKLAMVYTTVMLWCYFSDIKFEILSPSHWRSVLKEKEKVSFGRTRSDQKKAAKEFIYNKFNLKVTEDEADAICIALAAQLDKKKRAF